MMIILCYHVVQINDLKQTVIQTKRVIRGFVLHIWRVLWSSGTKFIAMSINLLILRCKMIMILQTCHIAMLEQDYGTTATLAALWDDPTAVETFLSGLTDIAVPGATPLELCFHPLTHAGWYMTDPWRQSISHSHLCRVCQDEGAREWEYIVHELKTANTPSSFLPHSLPFLIPPPHSSGHLATLRDQTNYQRDESCLSFRELI